MSSPSPLLLGATLLGGIGLFLLGMTMLTDGLKVAAGRALERILAAWTRTRLHGLATGVLLTALVQSSTAMTVAAIGFVNAGLLSFTSALWVVFGSNVGSSVTGWLVAAIGFNFKIDAFALPFIVEGMALKLTGAGTRRGALGTSLAGFGVLKATAHTKMLNFASNIGSLLVFIPSGATWWGVGFVMAVAQVAGAAVDLGLQGVVDGGADAVGVEAGVLGQVALGVEVDGQDAPPPLGQRRGQVDGRRRLAHSAFLHGYGDCSGHRRPVIVLPTLDSKLTISPK